jgi:hypothetical protein
MAARDHARAVDVWLGFDIAGAETRVRTGGTATLRAELETWTHLNPQIFLTSYLELRAILDRLNLKAGDHVVDLGCGYARMPFVLNAHHPGVAFTGIEAVPQRVDESQRVMKLHQVAGAIGCVDLCSPDFKLPQATVYFLYDFGTESDLRHFLEQWASRLLDWKPKIVLRGARVRHLVKTEWPWIWHQASEHLENLSIFDLASS